MTNTKICSKCNIEKDINLFGLRKNRKSGVRSHCKECCHIYNTTVKKKHNVVDIIVDGRICSKCNVWKAYDYFGKMRTTFDGLRSACKICCSKKTTI